MWVRNMADLLEPTCYEILCLLQESIEPPLAGGDFCWQQESAVSALTAFMDALKQRNSTVILRPYPQLQHRLFDLAQLILLTDVGELISEGEDFMFDLLSLSRALQPDPVHHADRSAIRQVRITFNSGSPDIFHEANRVARVDHSNAPGGAVCNTAYLKISYLLEAYVRCSKAKRKMVDMWGRVESVVGEFAVRDADRSCLALRRRLDEVVEAVRMLTVVEDGTPLSRFLQPQADEIFAALKEDALEARISLADRTRLARRRLKRWLRRVLWRIGRCLRRSLAVC